MLQFKFISHFLLAGAVGLLLTACGGGDSSDSGSSSGSATYTIGGNVSGLSGSVVLQLNGANNLTVSASGTFTFTTGLATAASYAVTVLTQPTNQVCTVSSGSGTIASANISNVAVNCVNTYTIGGSVSGLSGTGLVLQDNGGNNLAVTANGAFTFTTPIASGATYNVTVSTQPSAPAQTCVVTSGSGTVATANVTTAVVTCTTTISGVVAVGAPLVGTVTIKDSLGATKTVTIGTNGSYVVDVSGMTAPFVFRASGTANGTTYTVHSAAVAADLGGTINITQLTDLILDNVAGQLASNYFDNGNFSSLTDTALNAEVAKLKEKLLPVLTALGVSSTVDLLRSQFTPLASALDTALDVLQVSVDPATNIATITNIVTQQQIADTITVPASAETSPPVLTTTSNLSTMAADTAAVKAALNTFAARFATGLPTATNLQLSLTTDFLQYDQDRTAWAADISTESKLVGGSFTDVDVKNIDYSDLSKITASVDFTVKDSAGVEVGRLEDFRVRKDTDGIWRLQGNQQIMETEVSSTMRIHNGGGTFCVLTTLDFSFEDYITTNNGGTIDHLMVYGPGLPNGALRYDPPALAGDDWNISGTSSPIFIMGRQCTGTSGLSIDHSVSELEIAAIPDHAAYLVVAYSSADDSIRIAFPSGALTQTGNFVSGNNSVELSGAYLLHTQKRPLTLTETIAALPVNGGATGQFPVITAPVNPAALASYPGNGSALTITATGMNPGHYAEVGLGAVTTTTSYEVRDDGVKPDSSGVVTTSLSLAPALPTGTGNFRQLLISNYDTYRREFLVYWAQ